MSVEISVGNIIIKPVVPHCEPLLESPPTLRKKKSVDEEELKNVFSNLVENLEAGDYRIANYKFETVKFIIKEELVCDNNKCIVTIKSVIWVCEQILMCIFSVDFIIKIDK